MPSFSSPSFSSPANSAIPALCHLWTLPDIRLLQLGIRIQYVLVLRVSVRFKVKVRAKGYRVRRRDAVSVINVTGRISSQCWGYWG